jgi:hypothetical protein
LAECWVIEGYNGTDLVFSGTAPGNLGISEIETMLQRLASRHLTEREVIAASLRKKSAGYVTLLKPLRENTNTRTIIQVGSNPYYVATKEKPKRSSNEAA